MTPPLSARNPAGTREAPGRKGGRTLTRSMRKPKKMKKPLVAAYLMVCVFSLPALAADPICGGGCTVVVSPVSNTLELHFTGDFEATTCESTLIYWDGTADWNLLTSSGAGCVGNINNASGCGSIVNFGKISGWNASVSLEVVNNIQGSGLDGVLVKFGYYGTGTPSYYLGCIRQSGTDPFVC